MEFKYWEDVTEGEKLPTLSFPITIKTLVLAVCGTRDLMPYHHNSAYSKAIGNPDMFVNTMFEQALFGRVVTDWSGPESDFRQTSLQMIGQIIPGDTAVIEGAVTRKFQVGGDYRATIALSASNQRGVAARSSATIALPSRAAGPVRPLLTLEKPEIEVDPAIPDFAREWLGQVSPVREGAYPVSEAQIMYWCDMVEDGNPLYVSGEYAENSRHKGVIAPPTSLLTWAVPRAGQNGVNPDAPDVDCPERKPWPPPAGETTMSFDPPGATDIIATKSVQEYGRPLRPGDRVSHTMEVANCSPLKRTRLGLGYFQTNLNTFYNQRGELVGTNVFSLLRYGVPEEAES
jgi:acyl dehydratase